jgi:sec-independent protein translocase protein TatC
MEHLEELRKRLLYCVSSLVPGVVAGWFLFHPIYDALITPLSRLIEKHNGTPVLQGFAAAFLMQFQGAVVLGLILAFPFVVLQIWKFVAPALTKTEARMVYLIVPMILVLFFSGVLMAWWVMPRGIEWFLGYADDFGQARVLQPVNQLVVFYIKMCLAFGLAFQLPVFMMAAGRLGLVNHTFLTRNWRLGVVLIALAAGVITPSNDAPTMLLMASPMVLLYFVSILLVKWVEPKTD